MFRLKWLKKEKTKTNEVITTEVATTNPGETRPKIARRSMSTPDLQLQRADAQKQVKAEQEKKKEGFFSGLRKRTTTTIITKPSNLTQSEPRSRRSNTLFASQMNEGSKDSAEINTFLVAVKKKLSKHM
ncbi:Uncharacterised protein [Legionella hackeliae]|uniref:hypothetical protein n=1 Tax=Legionella hackeliae TaxID=449 RepID=UPI000E143B15|nr:hypothetical protein [Legionella hackeliae]STX48829.1 Uncharacterised protein [Legionella hackeliae]